MMESVGSLLKHINPHVINEGWQGAFHVQVQASFHPHEHRTGSQQELLLEISLHDGGQSGNSRDRLKLTKSEGREA